MLALVLSILQTVPINPFNLIATFKPVAIEAADSPLRKLQKECYNARLVAIQKTQAESPRIGLADDRPQKWRRLFDQIGPFADSGAILEPTRAGREKWYELRVAGSREAEWTAAVYIDGGREPPQIAHLMRAARMDAQIDLLTSFPTTNSPLLGLKDIPTRSNPKADRDPLEPELPQLIAAAVRPDDKDTPLQKLRKTRVRELALYVAKTNTVIELGRWDGANSRDFCGTHRQLGKALAELLNAPADKAKALELGLGGLKESERITGALVQAGRNRPQEVNVVRAARLDAEIELLRLRTAHKLATDEQPKVSYADPKRLALWKLPAFVLDAIKPDDKDTPLRKLQKARAGDRLVAYQAQKEVVATGQWNAEVFADTILFPAALAESLAEVMDTPADKIKCYEIRLERMKELEKIVADKVETGHSWPNDGYFAKVARIEAEIALLKFKEATKAGK
jgi:hypothetical protein